MSHWTAFGSERYSNLNKSQFLTVVKVAKSYKLWTLLPAAMFTSFCLSLCFPWELAVLPEIKLELQKLPVWRLAPKLNLPAILNKARNRYWVLSDIFSWENGKFEIHFEIDLPYAILCVLFHIVVLVNFDYFQSKKRGLSLEEKRTRMLELFFERVSCRVH